MEKENWINEILESANGIAKATPNASLFAKIQGKIREHEIVSSKWIWLAAASLTLLFLLNAKVVFGGKHKTEASAVESLATSLSNNNQLY